MGSVDEFVRCSVLVVDDDPLSVFLTEQLLKNDYEVKTVSSGYEAVSECERTTYDLILMDINLGDINMDGIRTMKMIRRLGLSKNAHIIALTAFSHSKKWYVDQGFNDLSIKPLTKTTLEAIDCHINRPSYRNAM